ncbi:MAG: hypothetical protein QGF68_21160, partial [Nitrospinota bacterium]|nr:hypothetical protein [Nitrospinota bacterium]
MIKKDRNLLTDDKKGLSLVLGDQRNRVTIPSTIRKPLAGRDIKSLVSQSERPGKPGAFLLWETRAMQKLGPKAQAAIDEVLSRFERGDLSPVTEIIRIRREGGEHPSDRWTFANQVLSFITSGSLDTRGIRQWNEVGRKVKKGSKAGFILIPITRKVEKEDPQTGEMVERSLPVGFKSCPVFAVESTEGDPVTLPDYTP